MPKPNSAQLSGVTAKVVAPFFIAIFHQFFLSAKSITKILIPNNITHSADVIALNNIIFLIFFVHLQ